MSLATAAGISALPFLTVIKNKKTRLTTLYGAEKVTGVSNPTGLTGRVPSWYEGLEESTENAVGGAHSVSVTVEGHECCQGLRGTQYASLVTACLPWWSGFSVALQSHAGSALYHAHGLSLRVTPQLAKMHKN